jgi:hypothetical protein
MVVALPNSASATMMFQVLCKNHVERPLLVLAASTQHVCHTGQNRKTYGNAKCSTLTASVQLIFI